MKNFWIAIFLLGAQLPAMSQHFRHGVGLNILVATADGGKSSVDGGFTYSPRINFFEQDDMSVSVGIPLTVGVSGSYSSSYNSYSGSQTTNTLSFLFNAPLMIDLNMGAGSVEESESRFGGFVGGGFGYHYGTFNLSDVMNGESIPTRINCFGPAANAGVRFAVGRGVHNVEVRLQYMKGINDAKPNIFSAGASFNF